MKDKGNIAFLLCLALVINAGFSRAYGISTVQVASGLDRPIYVIAPADDIDRLFIVEQHTGQIKILNLNTGQINSTPFLDIDGVGCKYYLFISFCKI